MGDALWNMLGSEQFWTVLAMIVGFIWSLGRVKDFRDKVAATKWSRLFDFACQAANTTYLTYVQELKRAREDGSLTKEEVQEAQKRALRELKSLLRSEAPSMLSKYGEEALKYVIQMAVNKLQGGGGDSE